MLEEHADELALIESRENGKPVQDARQSDISFLIAVFRFFGSLIDKLPTEFYDKGAIYTSTYLELFPAGHHVGRRVLADQYLSLRLSSECQAESMYFAAPSPHTRRR